MVAHPLAMIATCVMLAGGIRTAPDRDALFDHIVQTVVEREAFAPNKGTLEAFAQTAESLRDDFVNATTELELYDAIVRLSNMRRDEHLLVMPSGAGLEIAESDGSIAPIRFAADLVTGELFVADAAVNLVEQTPGLAYGATLVAIDGRPLDVFRAQIEPYLRAGSDNGRLRRLAEAVSAADPSTVGALRRSSLTVTLRTDRGTEVFLRVPMQDLNDIRWSGWSDQPGYRGFEPVYEREFMSLHAPAVPGDRVLILRVNAFREMIEDVDALMTFAAEHDLLGHDVIVDVSQTRGGSRSWYLLQRLTAAPFRVTHSNLRLSDVTPALVGSQLIPENSTRLSDWMIRHVLPACSHGAGWTETIPFKLRAIRAEGDGTLAPAPVRFTGSVIFLLGPDSWSAADQFAAMAIDNRIGHSIGLPTAGHSNSWDWRDLIRWPGTSDPVVGFMWALGHTFRPNGEVLEGNPVRPAEIVPITRENYRCWRQVLVERALQHLGHEMNEKVAGVSDG